MLEYLKVKYKKSKKYEHVRNFERKVINIYKWLNQKLYRRKFQSVKEEKFVKLIEKLSYTWCFILYLVGIFLFAYLYKYLSEVSPIIVSTFTENEKVVHPKEFFEFLYFSIVTISTLGYGDYRPIGDGRLLVMIQVLYGLIIFALFISKLASDRTASLVKLVYTSDVENRVRRVKDDFSLTIISLTELKDKYNDNEMKKIMKDLSRDLSTKYSFFKHQSKVGDINDRWAEKLYLKFIKTIYDTVVAMNPIIKISYLEYHKKNPNINKKVLIDVLELSQYIEKHFKYKKIKNICVEIEKIIEGCNSFKKLVDSKKCTKNDLLDIEDYLLIKVRKRLPRKIVKKNMIIEDIQNEFGISKKYISELVDKSIQKELFSKKNFLKVKTLL